MRAGERTQNRMPLRGKFALLILGLSLTLGVSSCGYTHGVLLPEEATSIGVAVFDNTSLFPEVEGEVFACMSTQASRMVSGRMLSPNRADLVVHGRILEYRRLGGAVDPQGRLLSSGVQVRLQAWIVDRRHGERIGQIVEVDRPVRYIFGAGEAEIGARRAALENLCQGVVLDLLNQPDYRKASDPQDVPLEGVRDGDLDTPLEEDGDELTGPLSEPPLVPCIEPCPGPEGPLNQS